MLPFRLQKALCSERNFPLLGGSDAGRTAAMTVIAPVTYFSEYQCFPIKHYKVDFTGAAVIVFPDGCKASAVKAGLRCVLPPAALLTRVRHQSPVEEKRSSATGGGKGAGRPFLKTAQAGVRVSVESPDAW